MSDLLSDITPLVLTYNEAPNITRCLDCLGWAEHVIVLDSGSTDETAKLTKAHANAQLHERPFDNHTAQWNHGIDLVPTTWVLSLDADYLLSPAFIKELKAFTPSAEVAAVHVSFRYCVFGQPLRACLYPPRAILFRKDRCRYVQDGHTQLLQVNGPIHAFKATIDHDDRKPLSRWLWAQDRYALLEAKKLSKADPATLRLQDRLRQWLIAAPLVTLFYTLLVRGVILDGWRGWYYAFQRTLAELLLSLRLLECKLSSTTNGERR